MLLSLQLSNNVHCKSVPSKKCSVLTRTGSSWSAFILGPGHEGHIEEQYCLDAGTVDKAALRNRRNALILLYSSMKQSFSSSVEEHFLFTESVQPLGMQYTAGISAWCPLKGPKY